MFHIVLHEPQIPPNTGNLMRMAVNTGCTLHLVHPIGFDLSEPLLRRAGLDYREHADVRNHDSFADVVVALPESRFFAFSGHAQVRYTDVAFQPGDALLFGTEASGLPPEVMNDEVITERLVIPIAPGGRSLNLANAASVATYEAWRQNGFATGRP